MISKMNIYFLFQKAPLAANSKRAILHQLHEYNKTIYKKVRRLGKSTSQSVIFMEKGLLKTVYSCSFKQHAVSGKKEILV